MSVPRPADQGAHGFKLAAVSRRLAGRRPSALPWRRRSRRLPLRWRRPPRASRAGPGGVESWARRCSWRIPSLAGLIRKVGSGSKGRVRSSLPERRSRRNRRAPPTTAFRRIPAVHGTSLEGPLRRKRRFLIGGFTLGRRPRLTAQQQRMGRVARPAGFADHHVEAETCKIIGVGVDTGVFRFVEDLGVGAAFIAGLGAREPGIAFNAAERECARAAADNADGAGVMPSGRAERAMEIARPRVLARGGDHARRGCRAAAGAEVAPFQVPEVGRPQCCGEPGKIDLQRRGDPEDGAGVGGSTPPRRKASARVSVSGASRRRRSAIAAAVGEGNKVALKLSSSAVRPSRQAASRRCPSAAMGGMRAATALEIAVSSGARGVGRTAAAAACARDASAMKASQPSAAWPSARRSSRSAVREKRRTGSGRTIGAGALTPPTADPVHEPFGAVSPCLMNPRPHDADEAQASRSRPGCAAICGGGATPSRA